MMSELGRESELELSQDLRRQRLAEKREKKGGQCVCAALYYRTHCAWNFNGPLDLTIEDQRWL